MQEEKLIKKVRYSYCLALEDEEGYILLSEPDAEKKALELIENTPQAKNLIDIFYKDNGADEIFLGMQDIKGGFSLGILMYKNEPSYPSLTTMTRALMKFTMENEDF